MMIVLLAMTIELFLELFLSVVVGEEVNYVGSVSNRCVGGIKSKNNYEVTVLVLLLIMVYLDCCGQP